MEGSEERPAIAEVLEKADSACRQHGLWGPENAVLLLVSGGSDSTALARIAADMVVSGSEDAPGALAMLHVNHLLRGEDSDGDARFCAELANELGIPFFLCEIDIAGEAERTGENVEAVARHERYAAAYEALASLCEHEGFPFEQGRIAVAHTLDDRMENFYMRSIVGTGPGGFRSMLYENGQVVRPLLDVTREELRRYLEDSAESAGKPSAEELWREDATNADTDRFRAYVRANIVPAAKEWDASAPQNLARSMNLVADEDDMLAAMSECVIEQHVEEGDGSFLLLPQFGMQALPLQRRAVVALLKGLLGQEERIAASTVQGVLDGFDADGKTVGGYTNNIQGNLAVSANKQGVLVEPMEAFRSRRKRL